MMAMGLILYFCDPSNLSVKQSALFPGWGVLSYMSGYACAWSALFPGWGVLSYMSGYACA